MLGFALGSSGGLARLTTLWTYPALREMVDSGCAGRPEFAYSRNWCSVLFMDVMHERACN
ncbi:hypothetical protein E2C01_046214 [Portunus trituberculatus]|uniref:Uncharacterized protein n=1 Tax=Portunus trituberculatus TaxID=210409 RepID=A0A5B7G5B3_PORTR|nr:hypothetical protein [Portunus trituberculatus]